MKKLLVGCIGLACALAITANAAPGNKGQKLTDEQKALMKEMVEKYDTNKDGKLDKEERAKMSKEDKKKLNEAFPHKKGEKKEDKK
ncbi:MAG TPA: hypothetical protein VNZ22_10355 [Bacillota bacterium]|nr:hypothetical protein [Bacillota bacterium]